MFGGRGDVGFGLLVIKCVPFDFVMCLSSSIICSVNLCMFLRDRVGVSIGTFLGCSVYCVSSGVGMRRMSLGTRFLGGLHWLFLVGIRFV